MYGIKILIVDVLQDILYSEETLIVLGELYVLLQQMIYLLITGKMVL